MCLLACDDKCKWERIVLKQEFVVQQMYAPPDERVEDAKHGKSLQQTGRAFFQVVVNIYESVQSSNGI